MSVMINRHLRVLFIGVGLLTACGQPATVPTAEPTKTAQSAPTTEVATIEPSATAIPATLVADTSSATIPPPATNTPNVIIPTTTPVPPTATAPSSPTSVPATAVVEPSSTVAPTNTLEPSVTPADASTASPFKLQLVAEGFTKPLYLVSAKDGTGRIFVIEQAGVVKIVRDGVVADAPFLDITDRVGSEDNEQGLLSIAFHPQFRENGFFFVDYTDKSGDTVVARYSSNGDTADPASEQALLKVDQPYANHNGGQLQFGPDGYLYISLGDGGSAGDPQNRSQNTDVLLGKLLRIDVNSGDPYSIPANNPFADGGGKPEIWALGLRNPWRFSFDRGTGDLWIGDVGQGKHEEVDFQPAGKGGVNYGWKQVEGSQCYVDGCDLNAYTPPVMEYSHDDGCSITGGYVYRGRAVPQLRGWYLYGDYCSGTIWMLRNDGTTWDNQVAIAKSGAQITSFGEDQQGEVYVIDRDGRVLRITTE